MAKRKRPERVHSGTGRIRECVEAGCTMQRSHGSTRCGNHNKKYDRTHLA